jgi:hypothetical protein
VLALRVKSAHSVRVSLYNVDTMLMITILAGFALGVVNVILAIVNGRSDRLAEVKSSAVIRELYQRTYKRGRRLVAITRAGKSERRAVRGPLDKD